MVIKGEVRISNESVQKAVLKLEQIADISLVATPSMVTEQAPNQWTLHIKRRDQSKGRIYIGTIFNEGSIPSPVETLPYTKIRPSISDDVPIEDWMEVIGTLDRLTHDQVYTEDLYKF